MALNAVCYVKARGGATTTAVGLAALLAETARRVVVECERAGGVGRVRGRIGGLVRQVTGGPLVMLVAGGPYRAADVQEYLHRHLSRVLELPADGVEVRQLLAYDERTAAVLDGSRKAGRRWR